MVERIVGIKAIANEVEVMLASNGGRNDTGIARAAWAAPGLTSVENFIGLSALNIS